jgi:hypothetical protein
MLALVDFVTPIIIIVILVVLTAVVNGWIQSSDRSFFDLAVKMPKFVDKPDARITDYEAPSSPNDKPGMIETYHQLRFIAIFVMAAAFILGMVLYLGEEFGIAKKGQAIQIISNTLVYTIFLTIFPILWDGLAVGVESLNVYILNPSNPTPDLAAARAKDVFMRVGGFTTDAPAPETLLKAGASMFVGDFGPITQFFHDSLTSVFRAFLVGLVFIMMYVIGTMRIVLTATIITGLPMILALKLIPWFKKVSDKLIDTLTGLVIATVISSIVIVAGGAYLDTLPHDTFDQNFQRWIASMAVVILAVFMPVMLSPMLGSIVSSVTGMVTTAFAAGAVAGSATVAGAAKGAAGGLGSIMQGGFGGQGGDGGVGGLGSRIAGHGMEAITRAGNFVGQAAQSGATQVQKLSSGVAPIVAEHVGAPSTVEPVIPATTSATPIASAPAPVILGPTATTKPDLSTIETVANVEPAKAGFSALAMQPSSEIFTPAPTITAGDKFAAIMKGAFVGGSVGMLQGLLKGVMMEAGSAGHGLGSIGTAFNIQGIANDVKVPVSNEVDTFVNHAKQVVDNMKKLLDR